MSGAKPQAPKNAGDIVAECKKELCEAEVEELWWDEFLVKWREFLVRFEVMDEEAKRNVARAARKRGKEQGLNPSKIQEEVERAVAAMPTQMPDTQPFVPAEIEIEATEELKTVRLTHLDAAQERLDLIRHKGSMREKRENEAAVHKATLADAKARVLGKPVVNLKKLHLPVTDFKLLKQGQGIRKNVSNFTGAYVEFLRQREHYGGEFALRSRGVESEWANQIGDALDGHIGDLTKLDLSCNRITSGGCQRLALGISRSSTLTALDLSNNLIDSPGMDILADALLVNTTITTLNLGTLKFGEKLDYFLRSAADGAEGAEALEEGGRDGGTEGLRATGARGSQASQPLGPSALKKPQNWKPGLGRLVSSLITTLNLRTLDLAGNKMGPDLFGQLCDSLTLNLSVRWLGVSGNCIGPDGGAHLGRLLAASNRIQYIDVGSNFLGPEGADYTSLQIDTNTGLHELRMASNGMGRGSAPWIGQITRYCLALRHLDLSGNEIDEDAVESFAKTFEDGCMTNLSTLKLSQNPIGDFGLGHLATQAGNLHSLNHLQLYNCEITDKGAAIAGALTASLSSLRKLELAYNRVGDEGMSKFADWVLTSGSRFRLTDLNLDGNLCGDSFIEVLATLLARGPFITSLSIRGNFLSFEGMGRVFDLIKLHPFIHDVKLEGNVMKDKQARRLVKEVVRYLEVRAQAKRMAARRDSELSG